MAVKFVAGGDALRGGDGSTTAITMRGGGTAVEHTTDSAGPALHGCLRRKKAYGLLYGCFGIVRHVSGGDSSLSDHDNLQQLAP